MIDIGKVYQCKARGVWRWPVVRHGAMAFLRWMLKEKEINQFLRQYGHLPLKEFIEAVFVELSVDYTLKMDIDAAISAQGRCVVVANHPLGGLDGLMLLHAMLSVRDDVKIIANEQLCALTPLAPYIIPVNVWKNDFARNQINSVQATLEGDGVVIVFPAGEVSRASADGVADRKWSKVFYQIAKRCDAPIVPIYVEGLNGPWFYRISRYLPFMSTLMLVREMWREQYERITLHMGKMLPISLLQSLPVDDAEVVMLIRAHVYGLADGGGGVFHAPQPVAQPVDDKVLQYAIHSTTVLGEINDRYRVLLHQPHKNPILLQEIGRLREISFRQVGEGSGQPRDLDRYDSHYQHLLVWDKGDQAIMGAYRVLPVAKGHRENRLGQLYTQGFFDFVGDQSWLDQAMELGRGFICPDYWNTRALDMMWQGIGAYYVTRPHLRYLFGGVSISPQYPKEAVDWLVSYYRTYFAPEKPIVRARNPYVIKPIQQRKIAENFAGLSRTEAEKVLKKRLKHMNLVIPPLLKHYAALCEEGGVVFGDFSVDPDFGFCVDGFVVVDMSRLKEKKHERYIAPFTPERVLEAATSSS